MASEMNLLPDGIRVDVHERGRDRSVDGILRLIEAGVQEQPLEDVLRVMCREVADIAGADVVSAYVRETGRDGDVLVMRGNHGFPASAIGNVRLKVGEGITGMIAECMRPVAVAVASHDEHYRHVPGLGEERFPAFLGIPLRSGAAVSGVLVLQRRRTEAFATTEVALATALAAPFAFALEAAQRRSAERASTQTRSARLTGVPVAAGAGMGRAAVVPTLSALPGVADSGVDLGAALGRLTADLDRVRRRLRRGERDEAGAAAAESVRMPDIDRAIANLELVLADQRFRERLLGGDGDLVERLSGVARDYARVPYRVPIRGGAIEPAMAERAREVEDLCVLLYASATRTPVLPPGAVWVTEHVGAFIALCAVARGAAAIAVDGHVDPDAAAVAIARAGGLPVLSQVEGLFAWARPGDLVVVDADGGQLRINPSATSVAGFRARRDKR